MSCHGLFFLRQIMYLNLYTCSCISIWRILHTFLYVTKSYHIHHSPWSTIIAFFSSSWVISHTHGGIDPLRWIYRSLKLFLPSWCLWPWELQILLEWILNCHHLFFRTSLILLLGGCIGSFLQFKCTSCMVRTISQSICITTNSYASCNCLANKTFIHIS